MLGAQPLWRVESYGQERHPPSERWWFDNRTRLDGTCVFQLTISGSMRLVDHGEHDVESGQAALFRHPAESAYGMAGDARETLLTEWLTLRGAGLSEHWQVLAEVRGPVLSVPIDGAIHHAMRHLTQLAEPRRRTGVLEMAAAVQAFVLQLWEQATVARASSQRPVEQAIDAMLAAPTAPWSLKSLADQHGISREHLARAFHERVGEPPATWLTAQRVKRALELLATTDLPIRAVRDQAGFVSSHTLIRRVRAHTGVSPMAWREQRRGG